MSDRAVDNLVAAITDGDAVDWQSAETRVASAHHARVVEELKTLTRLARGARSSPAKTPLRRLPLLLECMRLVAIVCTAVGAVGSLLQLAEPGAGYTALLLAALTAFAGAALFLDIYSIDRRGRALAAFYWAVSASFSLRGSLSLAQLSAGTRWLTGVVFLRPESFMAACLWQFVREFPSAKRLSLLDRICAVALQVTLAAGALLFVANLLPLVAADARITRWLAPFVRMSGYDRWFWTVAFFLSLPALGVITWRARDTTGEEHTRARLFLYAIALAIAPVTIEVIAEGLVPGYAAVAQGPAGRWWGGWIIYPPLLALPFVTAYAVAVKHVLSVRVAIRQGLRYLLAKWLIAGSAIVTSLVMVLYVYQHRNETLGMIVQRRPMQVLTLFAVAAGVLVICRPQLLRALNRWALPGSEDTSVVLAQMADRMKHTRTPLEVTSLLARAAERALQAPSEVYLVRNHRLLTVPGSEPAGLHSSLIPVLLEASRGPCLVSEEHRQSYYPLMTVEDRRWIAANGICVLVPVLSGRHRDDLTGVVALRGRRNALAYSHDDLRFLRAAAAAASLASDVLRAETHTPANAPLDESEEVAMECAACGRVMPWSAAAALCPCGGSWQPSSVPLLLASRWKVTERLGAGGMGIVYRAHDVTLGRDVAVKTLTRLSAGAAARLLVEARTMARLSHPNIATLYSTEAWRGTPLLVMEHLAGGTLTTRLARGRLSLDEAMLILAALAPTLDYVHRMGLYHGDIKPSNIGFSVDGAPKFLDFGLSRAVEREATMVPSLGAAAPLTGTFAYLSPEVREGAPPGPWLDVWGLSMVLCESLMGAHPCLDAATTTEMHRAIAQATAALQPLAPSIAGFLARALAPAAARYPVTAVDLVKEVAVLTARARH